MEIWILGHKWHANDWVIWRARIFGSRPLGQVPKIFWRARILFLGPVHWDRSQNLPWRIRFFKSIIVGRRHRRSTFRQSQGWMMDDGWWKTDRPRSEIWMSSTSSIDSHNDEWWITVKLSMTIDDDRRFECRRHRRSTHRQSQWWMMDNSNIEYVDRPRSEIECRRHRRSTMIDCDDYDDYSDYDDYDDWIIDNKKYKYPFN